MLQGIKALSLTRPRAPAWLEELADWIESRQKQEKQKPPAIGKGRGLSGTTNPQRREVDAA